MHIDERTSFMQSGSLAKGIMISFGIIPVLEKKEKKPETSFSFPLFLFVWFPYALFRL